MPAIVSRQNPYVSALRDAVARSVEGEPLCVGRDGASDAVSFLEAGVPAVEFGPVGGGHHGPEEWVSYRRWAATASALGDFVRGLPAWLGAQEGRPAGGRGRTGLSRAADHRGLTVERHERVPARPRARGLLLRTALGGSSSSLLHRGDRATAGLLEVDEPRRRSSRRAATPIPNIRASHDAQAGGPQTILVLGSDRRYADGQRDNPARSDTIMLLRLDPNQPATAIMSLPRDLKVEIPGHGIDKINAAYALRRPDARRCKTVKQLPGSRSTTSST